MRYCATRWEQELQKEVKDMKEIFALNENAILVQQSKNRFLKIDSNRLLEQLLQADFHSSLMNELHFSSNAELFVEYCAELVSWRSQNETLKHQNDTLRQNSDDVINKLSNEICQLKHKIDWCQAQSIETELQLCTKIESQKNKCRLP